MLRSLYMVELTVVDPAASLAWYRDRFGFSLTLFDPVHGFALFTVGSARLALKQGTPQGGGVKVFFEVTDLDAELERLKAVAIVPIAPIKSSDEGYRRVLFHDPDGYTIGLFEWEAK